MPGLVHAGSEVWPARRSRCNALRFWDRLCACRTAVSGREPVFGASGWSGPLHWTPPRPGLLSRRVSGGRSVCPAPAWAESSRDPTAHSSGLCRCSWSGRQPGTVRREGAHGHHVPCPAELLFGAPRSTLGYPVACSGRGAPAHGLPLTSLLAASRACKWTASWMERGWVLPPAPSLAVTPTPGPPASLRSRWAPVTGVLRVLLLEGCC